MQGYGTLPAIQPTAAARDGSANRMRKLVLIGAAGLLVAACALMMLASSSPKPTALLGYDPFNSISRPGRSEGDAFSDFAPEDGADTEHLPDWATEWTSEEASDCAPGAECDDIPNPLGAIGAYVMRATAPHYNTQADRHKRHSCNGLPGWALEECMRVREGEKGLDASGKPPPAVEEEEEKPEEGEEAGEEEPSEERAFPTMLASVRNHPALWAALPARNSRIAQGQRWVQ